MIGITILSHDPSSGGTRALYCPPTFYRPNAPSPSLPYSSLAGTAARCYIPHRHRHLYGLSPDCYFSEPSTAHTYSSPPGYERTGYQPCSYGYLYSGNQGYYDPCAGGYPSRDVQRRSDPYGLEYLYSYRRRLCDPCNYGSSPTYARRCYDPSAYNYPSGYGRSYYPSRGYTYRCGYSNDPCGYSNAPGSTQPCYADRRRYSCRPVSSDRCGFSSESPYSPICRRRSSDGFNNCSPY